MFLRRRLGDGILRCSFCSKTHDAVDTLISNPFDRSSQVYICDECIEVCNAVLKEHRKAKEATVEARLKAAVLEEHRKATAAGATVVACLKAFAAHE